MPSREINCPHCGALFEPKANGKPRSTPQHRRFFGLCTAAFDQWPETHAFRPKNPEHLRAWLEVQAQHFQAVKTIRCNDGDVKRLTAVLTAVLRTCEDDKVFVEADGQCVIVKRALSIAYDKLPHLQACRLFDDVADVIRVETGIEPDQLLSDRRRAA